MGGGVERGMCGVIGFVGGEVGGAMGRCCKCVP